VSSVGCAGGIGNHQIVAGQRLVVDAVDDSFIGARGGGRHDHAARPVFKVDRRLVTRGENAGTFHHDINVGPWQFGWIADRSDGNGSVSHVDCALACDDFHREAAMDAIVLQQMCIGRDRA
jgi:hypothetical protein